MTVTRYIYFGDQLIGEADENNTVTRRYINKPDQYTNPIGHVDVDTGKPAYYHYDGQGNTRAVTDENGDVTDTFDYDAWGNLLARTGTTNVPFEFGGEHGYYKDEELDTYYVMARKYDPSINRWLSIDPLINIQDLGAITEPYLYVGNNPVMRIDPSGEDYAECEFKHSICRHRGKPFARLDCYYYCRCGCDPPMQNNPNLPNYEPGLEVVASQKYPCEGKNELPGNIDDAKACEDLGLFKNALKKGTKCT